MSFVISLWFIPFCFLYFAFRSIFHPNVSIIWVSSLLCCCFKEDSFMKGRDREWFRSRFTYRFESWHILLQVSSYTWRWSIIGGPNVSWNIGPRKKLCMLCFRLTCSFKLSLLITNLVKAFMPWVLVGSTHVFSFPNDPNQSAISRTSSVGGFSRSLSQIIPLFFQFSPGQSGVGNFAAGIFVGSPSYPGSMDKQPINKSTKPWKRPMDRHSCVVPWPGFLWSCPCIPCSDAVACSGWLKIYMQSAEDVIKERLQVEGQVKADVLALAWAGSKFYNCLFSESPHAGCKCIHRILRRF